MRVFLVAFVLTLWTCAASATWPSYPPKGVNLSQAAAYIECMSYEGQKDVNANNALDHCRWQAGYDGVTPTGSSASCTSVGPVHYQTAGMYQVYNNFNGAVGSLVWCIPDTCATGDNPDGAGDHTYSANYTQGSQVSKNGCCYTFNLTSAGGNADGTNWYSIGSMSGEGTRCKDNTGASGEPTSAGALPIPPKLTPIQYCPAGKLSCWNPFTNQFCAASQSGEWSCVGPPGDQSGCASGATGSECFNKQGQPTPTPPNPPISSGTPPDTTNNYTINDGTTTNNYTTNNYSGTSPGGGSGSSSPPSSSPGGSGSNVNGNGNTGKNGTDANGNCPNGSKPTASGCSGTYTDNGCNTPPACFGDAVLCGIAANTHKSACAASGSSVGAPPSGLDGDPTDNTGDPGSSAVSSSVDLGAGTGSLDGSGFGYSSSCPLQDLSFSVLGQSVNIPLADKCDKLVFLKYIVLALAYFMAAKIMAGVQ